MIFSKLRDCKTLRNWAIYADIHPWPSALGQSPRTSRGLVRGDGPHSPLPTTHPRPRPPHSRQRGAESCGRYSSPPRIAFAPLRRLSSVMSSHSRLSGVLIPADIPSRGLARGGKPRSTLLVPLVLGDVSSGQPCGALIPVAIPWPVPLPAARPLRRACAIVSPQSSVRGADFRGRLVAAPPPHCLSAQPYTYGRLRWADRHGRPAASSAAADQAPPPHHSSAATSPHSRLRRTLISAAVLWSLPLFAAGRAHPPLPLVLGDMFPRPSGRDANPHGHAVAAPVARPRRHAPAAVRAGCRSLRTYNNLICGGGTSSSFPRHLSLTTSLRGRPPRALIPVLVPWQLPLSAVCPRRYAPTAARAGCRSPRPSNGLVYGGRPRSLFPGEDVVALALLPRQSTRATTRSEDGGTRHWRAREAQGVRVMVCFANLSQVTRTKGGVSRYFKVFSQRQSCFKYCTVLFLP